MLAEPLAVALLVGDVFDALGVPWVVGGSVASSLRGVPRSTQDVDIVADLRGLHVGPFVAALEDRFYVDAGAVRDAVVRRSSFNLIHLGTMTKVDVFTTKPDPMSRSEMGRRQRYEAEPGVILPVASPEDVVLQKLDGFRKGGGVSERQWRDVLGVLQVGGPGLDHDYMRRLAGEVGLADLLEDALRGAGP
ncbi:hypothetical protein L6R50_08360 [Myxococcota bacterium]|nr:hypothetical protein [Myxococcota bacterium]